MGNPVGLPVDGSGVGPADGALDVGGAVMELVVTGPGVGQYPTKTKPLRGSVEKACPSLAQFELVHWYTFVPTDM